MNLTRAICVMMNLVITIEDWLWNQYTTEDNDYPFTRIYQ